MSYSEDKYKYSYELYKKHKFFKKVRSFIIKDNKLLVIKAESKDNNWIYLLPGGGVDEGETVKQAAVRESLEEYNINVKPIKYLGKHYYNVPIEYDNKKFISNRVEYYYLCEYISDGNFSSFGIEGEFTSSDKKFTKTELSLNQIRKTDHKKLNQISRMAVNDTVKNLW